MYLVHAHLRSPTPAALPSQVAELFACCAEGGQLEHVTVHTDQSGDPVVGLFMTAGDLGHAEQRALALCRLTLANHPELRPFCLVSCGAVLVPEYWDRMLAESDAGRIVPVQDPSNLNPFHPF
jgi:hypothetical protein